MNYTKSKFRLLLRLFQFPILIIMHILYEGVMTLPNTLYEFFKNGIKYWNTTPWIYKKEQGVK